MRPYKINLPRAPRILFVIGLAGVGKSYVGNLIGSLSDYYVYHADDDLPLDMRRAVERNEPWTEGQRDGFYSLIRKRVVELARLHAKVVVTQATYKQRHRELMLEVLPELEFLWVVADHEVNLKRIKERGDYVSEEFFERAKSGFEAPSVRVNTVVNNGGDEEIIRQLVACYG